jgi:hypothetical protein
MANAEGFPAAVETKESAEFEKDSAAEGAEAAEASETAVVEGARTYLVS